MLRLRSISIPVLCTLALACGPAGSGGDDEAGETEGTSDTGETSDTGGAPLACERVEGGGEDGLSWALRCGGPTYDRVVGSGVDGAGNIYFGVDLRNLDGAEPFTIGDFEVVPGELSDMLMVKLDPEGEALWVEQIGGPGDQFLGLLEVCGDGVVISGSLQDAEPLDLGDGPLSDDFIAAFDGGGQHRWSRNLEVLDADGHVTPLAMTCDDQGNLAVTGRLRGAIDFGGGPVTPNELFDGFLARYDGFGQHQWSRSFAATGSNYVSGRALAADAGGELVLVGSFDGTIDLGGGPLVANAGDDTMVAKLAPNGDHLWSFQIGPEGLQYGTAVALDSQGALAFGGIFLEGVEIGDDSYANVFPDAEPDIYGTVYDVFIGGADANGVIEWSTHIGNMLDDRLRSLAYRSDDSLALGAFTNDEAYMVQIYSGLDPSWTWTNPGLTDGELDVGPDDALVLVSSPEADLEIGGAALPGFGSPDIFVAKFTP